MKKMAFIQKGESVKSLAGLSYARAPLKPAKKGRTQLCAFKGINVLI